MHTYLKDFHADNGLELWTWVGPWDLPGRRPRAAWPDSCSNASAWMPGVMHVRHAAIRVPDGSALGGSTACPPQRPSLPSLRSLLCKLCFEYKSELSNPCSDYRICDEARPGNESTACGGRRTRGRELCAVRREAGPRAAVTAQRAALRAQGTAVLPFIVIGAATVGCSQRASCASCASLPVLPRTLPPAGPAPCTTLRPGFLSFLHA